MKKNRQQNTVIQLQNVTKIYSLKTEKPTFFESIKNVGTKNMRFTALDNISFSIQKGESVGIIGSNGAGKTTLIKVISEITSPGSGVVSTKGAITSIIDLSAGFHPDLVGKDNVLLNGLLLGMTKAEVQSRMAAIRSFADIGDHFDAPLYTYSSGMKLRLGLSVAIHAQPDILLVDESIMAGDEEFQAKARKKILAFIKQKNTFVLVSHNLYYLRSLTKRIIWMEEGKIRMDGGHEVVDAYVAQAKTK